MNTCRDILPAILLLGSAAAWGGESVEWPEIEGSHNPRADWLITAQPQPHELVAASQAGARHVVNARDTGEFTAWDESALVESLGMRYHHLPIGGPADLDRDAIERFDRILDDIADQPALLHCASGNRIGALFALRAAWIEGEDTETAIEIGKAHGLTGLAGAVRSKLQGDEPESPES